MPDKGMVHALHEAHRVLRTDGLLIDLRPSSVHRRVAVERAGRRHLLGVMREWFRHERAADRAVAVVVRRRLFAPHRRSRFPCRRVMTTLDEFQAWLKQWVELDEWPQHDWLVRRVARHLDTRRTGGRREGAWIVVTGPVDLQVLRRA